jgi:hypothetical protein
MELPPVALTQVSERVTVASSRGRDRSCFLRAWRQSNWFGADRHRHDRFDGTDARESSVIRGVA